jgi:hypothetical protein
MTEPVTAFEPASTANTLTEETCFPATPEAVTISGPVDGADVPINLEARLLEFVAPVKY